MNTTKLWHLEVKSEWSLEQDPCTGCLYWYSPHSPYTIWATPYWEEVEGIPIQVCDADGNVVIDSHIPFPGCFTPAWNFIDLHDVDAIKYNQLRMYQDIMAVEIPKILTNAAKQQNGY